MKTTPKKLLIILSAASLSVVLGACGGAQSVEGGSAVEAPDTTTNPSALEEPAEDESPEDESSEDESPEEESSEEESSEEESSEEESSEDESSEDESSEGESSEDDADEMPSAPSRGLRMEVVGENG